MMPQFRHDYSPGTRWGRLVVVKEAVRLRENQPRVICRCDCGGTKTVRTTHLSDGNVTSCGCGRRWRGWKGGEANAD